MIKRNVTSTLMVVAAGVLMFTGVAMANQQIRGVPIPVSDSRPSRSIDDRPVATSSPELEPGDDNGLDATAEPKATPDDKGGHGTDDATSPTASPDDKGGSGGGHDGGSDH